MAANVNVPKKAMSVSLPEALLSEASHLGVYISEAAEAGLTRAVSDKRAELWLKENANGLPLQEFRRI